MYARFMEYIRRPIFLFFFHQNLLRREQREYIFEQEVYKFTVDLHEKYELIIIIQMIHTSTVLRKQRSNFTNQFLPYDY